MGTPRVATQWMYAGREGKPVYALYDVSEHYEVCLKSIRPLAGKNILVT